MLPPTGGCPKQVAFCVRFADANLTYNVRSKEGLLMDSESRYLRSQAIFAEEEAVDLLSFLVTERGLSREDKSSVLAGIRDRYLFLLDYYRPQEAGSAVVERKLYSAKEAAALLTRHGRPVNSETVRRWARDGSLEAGWGKVPGGRGVQWVISPRSLKRCLEGGVPDPGTYANPESINDQPTTGYLENLLHDDPDA